MCSHILEGLISISDKSFEESLISCMVFFSSRSLWQERLAQTPTGFWALAGCRPSDHGVCVGVISGNKWSAFCVHWAIEKVQALRTPISSQFSKRQWLGQWNRRKQLSSPSMRSRCESAPLLAVVVPCWRARLDHIAQAFQIISESVGGPTKRFSTPTARFTFYYFIKKKKSRSAWSCWEKMNDAFW